MNDENTRADAIQSALTPDLSTAGDLTAIASALESILWLQRIEEERPHLRRCAIVRLHQVEGALHSLLRAVAGTKHATMVYGQVAQHVYSPDDIGKANDTSNPQLAIPTPPASTPTITSEDILLQASLLTTTPGETESATAPRAIGQFDGSADPNPGGRMGMGWHITLPDGHSLDGASEAPAQPGNTNNRAEYLALIALLKQYHQFGGGSPLLVRGDSQLVIQQMLGRWRVRDPMLQRLYTEAQHVVMGIKGGVRFEWVPRDQNRRADALASGEPQGDFQAETSPPVFAAMPLTSDISSALAEQIEAMNARGYASFKQYAALRVGGRDACSQLSWNQLITHAGAEATGYCTNAFPQDARAKAAALRWVARGLAAHLAVKKIQCDQAMMAKRQHMEL